MDSLATADAGVIAITKRKTGEKYSILLTLFIVLSVKNVICEQSENTTETSSHKIDEEELIQSESKDDKLEIIKRIKKVNPDGSYTIGYEADDGSFKIESRDVLGNIKGTYGFVDDEGEVKRVSYSSSNASDAFTKHEPVTLPPFASQSVVQRIPKTKYSTTRRPSTFSTTTPTSPTTTPLTVTQNIDGRRASSTTIRPTYNSIDISRSSSIKSNSVIYTSATPRVLLQRPSLTSTITTKSKEHETKSEGQIGRPEIHEKPTELPIFRNRPTKNIEIGKPVTEEASEIRSNILRRQLPQATREPTFNTREHVYNLQQSLGHNDVSDVYNSGVTVTSRPLFTTTRWNGIAPKISTTTAAPVAVSRPTSRYVANYQRNQLQGVESNTATYRQPAEDVTTSTEPTSTTTNLPVVQIPANRASTSEPLVAIRQPFQHGAILVPLSQLQNRIFPVDNVQDVYDDRRQYVTQKPVQITARVPSVERERQNVKRFNPTILRPLPVHVDENGYIREMPHYIPTPYPLPIPIAPQMRPIPVPVKAIDNNINNHIENIQPPVSTKDFQTLLNQLILRQKRLERISILTNPKVNPEFYQQQPVRYQRVVPVPQPIYVQRVVVQKEEFDQDDQAQQTGSTSQYVAIRPQEIETNKRYTYQYNPEEENEREVPKRTASTYERQSAYLTNSRAARLLPVRARLNQAAPVSTQDEAETQTEQYLPPEVREMLLLRMLQLAMNPELPLDEEEESQQVATVTTPQYRRAPPVINVEILGEQDGADVRKIRPVARTKRYKDEDMEYME